MPEQLLIRDVMRIGVPTCKLGDTLAAVAQQMLEQNAAALVVLDEDGDTAGWIGEIHLARAYLRLSLASTESALTASQVMDEAVPEFPAVDVPLAVAAQFMVDQGVDHLFFLHHAGGRAWPASLLTWRDIVRAMAGPEYLSGQGAGAPRPTPLDLFRQRYQKPDKLS